jgi:hypothetical protein
VISRDTALTVYRSGDGTIDLLNTVTKQMAQPMTLSIDTSGSLGNPTGTLDAKVTPLQPKQSARKWYRVKESRELVQKCGCGTKWCDGYRTFTDPLRCHPSGTVELAYPRPGEWWDKRPCEKSHAGWAGAWQYGASTWGRAVTDDPTDCWAKAAECGCLVPINFGHGDKKSGVA